MKEKTGTVHNARVAPFRAKTTGTLYPKIGGSHSGENPWHPLPENRWRPLGENLWHLMGENGWLPMGENLWLL